ncbi:MAG: LLM class flavin-dependent oxidoreductase [Actinomycetota bacterium]
MTMQIGACLHREHSPAAAIDQARAAETAGYDEFWVIEDCFYTAGPSLAAAALTATESSGVGIGIMPAVARNPAVTAMEIATLAGLGPGRFHAGIGHGVQSWMAQMNERRDSPLAALTETIEAVRRLLAGEEVTVSGRYVSLDAVALDRPPTPAPPVSAGVRGPKSLAAAGRVADGTILADFVSPSYVAWAAARVAEGTPAGGAAPPVATPHRLTVFAAMAIAPDGDRMRRIFGPILAEACVDPAPSLRMAPFFDELAERAAEVGWPAAVDGMPADWWHQIAAVGDPDDAAAYVERMAAAGVDALAFFPDPADPVTDLTRSAAALRRGLA